MLHGPKWERVAKHSREVFGANRPTLTGYFNLLHIFIFTIFPSSVSSQHSTTPIGFGVHNSPPYMMPVLTNLLRTLRPLSRNVPGRRAHLLFSPMNASWQTSLGRG